MVILFQVRFGQNYRYGEQGTHGTGYGYVGMAYGYVNMVLDIILMYRIYRTHDMYLISDRFNNRYFNIKNMLLMFY